RTRGTCPTSGDSGAIEARIDVLTNGIGAALTGLRFVDNGDGTVTDNQTGLQWDKKVAGSACLHCVNDVYAWTSGSTDQARGRCGLRVRPPGVGGGGRARLGRPPGAGAARPSPARGARAAAAAHGGGPMRGDHLRPEPPCPAGTVVAEPARAQLE